MPPHGSQKFLGRVRPSRVVMTCDEEANRARIKVSLPFVAGVLADLSGRWAEPDSVEDKFKTARGELEQRKFLEIDQSNFSERMKAIRPTVAFNVSNTLTGEGNIPVNLTFESMDDFLPDRIAERLEPLKALLDLRKQLDNLRGTASNKPKLERALEKIVANPDLVKALKAAISQTDKKPAN